MRTSLTFLLLCITTIAQAATPQALYTENCAHCHTPGISGAPKIGDRSEWSRRIRPGFRLLYQSAIEGIPNTTMAAKGGHRELGDADIRAIVDFMIAATALPQSALDAAVRYEALGITDREFIRLDADFDGALKPDEVRHDRAIAQAFARFDRNRDGRLDAAEYRALETQLERERAAVNVDDVQLVTHIRAALRALQGFPEKDVKVEAAAGAVVLTGVVPEAEDVRRGWLATRRIAGIKTLDNRLVSGALLAWD